MLLILEAANVEKSMIPWENTPWLSCNSVLSFSEGSEARGALSEPHAKELFVSTYITRTGQGDYLNRSMWRVRNRVFVTANTSISSPRKLFIFSLKKGKHI